MNIKELYEPLEQKSRRGRGGNYNYVSWQDVADRMNKVFDGNWSSEVKSQEMVGNNVIVRVRVTATDPETQMSFHQEGFGGAVDREADEAGNPWKSAYSKAFRDACKKWGIGLFLDDEAGMPGPAAVPPTPSAPKPVFTPLAAETPAPTPPPATPEVPVTPAVPEPQAVAEPATPPPNVPEAPAVPPTPPATPAPAAPPSMPAMPADDMPMSSGVLSNDDNGKITEVQQIALEGILNMRDLNYEDLAKEAFENKGMKYDTIPRAEDLTYEEAVVVVKFGNDKYRKK